MNPRMFRPRKRPRTLLMVLLLLTGGAIVNVAVAWGLTLLQGSCDQLSRHEADAQPVMFRALTANELQWCSTQGRLIDAFNIDEQSNFSHRLVISEWRNSGLRIRFFYEEMRFGAAYRSAAIDLIAGWPLPTVDLCMDARFPINATRTDIPRPKHTGWELRRRVEQAAPTVLPVILIWPGVAINTIFYAAILWLLFAAPGFVRRRIRARRGQCTACAYPIGASDVCTECGAVLPLPLAEGRGEGKAR